MSSVLSLGNSHFLNLQSQNSTVRTLMVLILKVLLDNGNRNSQTKWSMMLKRNIFFNGNPENSFTTIDVNESPWISIEKMLRFNLMDILESR